MNSWYGRPPGGPRLSPTRGLQDRCASHTHPGYHCHHPTTYIQKRRRGRLLSSICKLAGHWKDRSTPHLTLGPREQVGGQTGTSPPYCRQHRALISRSAARASLRRNVSGRRFVHWTAGWGCSGAAARAVESIGAACRDIPLHAEKMPGVPRFPRIPQGPRFALRLREQLRA